MKRTLIVMLLLTQLISLIIAAREIEEGQTVVGIFRKVRIQPNAMGGEPVISFTVAAETPMEFFATNTTEIQADQKETETATVYAATPKPDTIHRIVGGQQVSISQVPWQAALIQNGNFVCGSTIVSTIWVLTAAHCVYGFGNSNFTVRAGSDSFRTGGQVRRVGFTAVHGQYNGNAFANDVAMLRVTRRFTFGTTLQPARVPPQNTAIPQLLVVSGWGSTSSSSTSPTRRLRGVVLNLINRRRCNRNYANTQYTIAVSMFCAAASGRDSCQGDSGGGLINDRTVYGVVSFGIGCANASYPGVNTNVPYMSSWILNVARIFSRRRIGSEDPVQGMKIVMV